MLPEDDPHPASLESDALLRDCRLTRGRASGPGGQHRNKVETAVSILHGPSGCEGWASERRSQQENKQMALKRLRLELALKVRVNRRLPSQMWQSRLRNRRIALSTSHQDFPAMLAEALDFIALERFDVAKAAKRLECSTSQLIRLLKDAPAAMQMVNDARKTKGKRTLY